MPSVQCPHCAAKLKVTEAVLGKHGRCPQCQQKFLLQLPEVANEYDLAPLDAPAPKTSSPAALAPRKPAAASQPATVASKDRLPVEQPAEKRIPVWLIPAVIGGGLLAASMLALVVWVSMSNIRGGGGAGNGAAPGEASQASLDDSAPIVAPARPATAGRTSSVSSVAVESAAPGTWHVTADGVPLQAGLKSFVPLEGVRMGSLAFSRPDLAEAAIIEPVNHSSGFRVFDWVQVDLRQEKPPQRIHLWQEDTPHGELLKAVNDAASQSWSLSPSGQRLAVASQGAVGVWARDGTRVAHFPAGIIGTPVPWMAFAGEETLWVRAQDQLLQFKLPGGEMAHKSADPLVANPTLTPGGKYLLAVTNHGLVVLSAADGAQAGVLALPAGFNTNLPPAINPAGTKVAVALADQRANALFIVWDLATGKQERAIEQTYARVQQRLVEYRLAWLGVDVLLIKQTFFHLGLGEILAGERGVDALPVGPSPDGRLWQVRPIIDPKQAAQLGEQPPAAGSPPKVYLTAASLPPPAMQGVIQQTGGFAWHPGIAVKGELLGVPQKHRDAVAAGFSDWLAGQGFTVDPQAKIKIELTVSREPDAETTGKTVPQEQLTPAMKKHLRHNPNEEWVEMLTLKSLRVEGKVYDAAGKPAFLVPPRVTSRPTDKKADDGPVWQALAKWEEGPQLPETFFRDSDGKRVYLPSSYILPGADGVIDAIIDPPPAAPLGRDPFELPEEK